MAINKNPDNDEEMYVDLDLDDGTVTCSIVAIFSAAGKDYIALLPLDENGENTDGDVWIYGYKEDPEHPEAEPEILYIEDEDEYEAAADAFDEYLDAQEFDELIEGAGEDSPDD